MGLNLLSPAGILFSIYELEASFHPRERRDGGTALWNYSRSKAPEYFIQLQYVNVLSYIPALMVFSLNSLSWFAARDPADGEKIDASILHLWVPPLLREVYRLSPPSHPFIYSSSLKRSQFTASLIVSSVFTLWPFTEPRNIPNASALNKRWDCFSRYLY